MSIKKTVVVYAMAAMYCHGYVEHDTVGRFPREIVIRFSPSDPLDISARIKSSVEHLDSIGGGIIYFPGGPIPYGSGNVVSLSNDSNITFMGDGNSSKIVTASGSDLSDALFQFNNCTNIAFEKLNFVGQVMESSKWNTNQDYSSAIVATNSSSISIINCTFSGFYSGAIKLQTSSNAKISGNTFINVANRVGGVGFDYGAIALENATTDVIISNNMMSGIIHSGISGVNSNKVVVTGNDMTFNPLSPYTMGIYCPNGAQEWLISGNSIKGAYNEGITLNGSDYPVNRNTISNNMISAKFIGISINTNHNTTKTCLGKEAQENIITGNNIFGEYQGLQIPHAISVSRAFEPNISNNIVRFVQTGIEVHDCSYSSTIMGNNISNANTAISVFGTTTITGNNIGYASLGIGYGGQNDSIVGPNTNAVGNNFTSVQTRFLDQVQPSSLDSIANY